MSRMTKGELRRARKQLRNEGRDWREADPNGPAVEFSESSRGRTARYRWARRYDDLNGAPEGDWDR